jgi:hypothetical protein
MNDSVDDVAEALEPHWPVWDEVGSTSMPCACGETIDGVTWVAFYCHCARALLSSPWLAGHDVAVRLDQIETDAQLAASHSVLAAAEIRGFAPDKH